MVVKLHFMCTLIYTREGNCLFYGTVFFLVRQVRRDERKYYEELLQYSKQHLMVSLIH